MTWDTDPDNTNLATITEASLGPYVSGQRAFTAVRPTTR